MLNQLQENLLTMLEWFHNFCVENNLRYYITGGTMLGACRHKGFIPWDDDIDVCLPRPDFNRLSNLASSVNGRYIFETVYSKAPDYLYGFTKLYDSQTSLTEIAKKPCHRGVYIDVFPLDGLGDTYEESLANYKPIDRLNMFLMTRICAVRKDRSWYKNIAISLSNLIPSIFVDEKKLFIKVDTICQRRDYDTSEYVANCYSTYRSKDIVNRSLYGIPQLYDFENIKVYGVEKPDEFLTHLYGDWRSLPPVEKRHSAHDFTEIDFQKSFL